MKTRQNAMEYANDSVLNLIYSSKKYPKPASPFMRWHLTKKYETIDRLLKEHLFPGSRFIDVACGDGDALVLAEHFQRDCELWGVDIDQSSLKSAKKRVPRSILVKGDMLNLEFLPEGYFDVVHEFGATFYIRDWKALASQYIRLVRDGGIVLWELPQKWSIAHLLYMLTIPPKFTESDTRIRRVLRFFSYRKYTYLSDEKIADCIKASGFEARILKRVPIWYFFCMGISQIILDNSFRLFRKRQFDILERLNKMLWPRLSGFYLVIQRKKSEN